MDLAETLAPINAAFNGLAFVFLVLGFMAIKRGDRERHRRMMLSALTASALFLVGYIIRMALHGTSNFPDLGWIRTAYRLILGSHSVLAAVNLPLIVLALNHALRGRYEQHRRIVRWAWPIWAYVSVTGVMVYLLLHQIAPRLAPGAEI